MNRTTTTNAARSHPCGIRFLPDGSISWRVWAPHARRVELVVFHGAAQRCIPMQSEPLGYFSHTQRPAGSNQRYAYRLDGGADRPDPCSRWQPDGVHRPSAAIDLGAFEWTDHRWTGVRREDLVIYELHVGTFTQEGTFEAIIPRLRSLHDLGVTAIELMPIGQFPGRRNWGYDGVLPFAAQNSYGGPHGLRKLVDACHEAGLAMLLDVVYNHVGPEGNYLAEFGPYFTDRYKTGWGPALNFDGCGSYAVRDYVLENVRMWIEDYHFDGLRLDAVHAIFDESPIHILQAIKTQADSISSHLGRPVHIIAESDLNDPKLLRPQHNGGYAFDAQWCDDFHHSVHAVLSRERHGYYADFGTLEHLEKAMRQPFVYDGVFSCYRNRYHGTPTGDLNGDQFVVSIQNHDQVGNRARGERIDLLVNPAARRLAAALMLLAPRLPLLFMGEEYGEMHPFPFFCSFEDPNLVEAVRAGRRNEFAAFAWADEVPDPQDVLTFQGAQLTWSWPAGSREAGIRQLYHDLLAARRAWPPLRCFSHDCISTALDQATSLLTITRRTPDMSHATVRIHVNLGERPSAMHAANAGERLLFRSEDMCYAVDRREPPSQEMLYPYECVVIGPAQFKSCRQISTAE